MKKPATLQGTLQDMWTNVPATWKGAIIGLVIGLVISIVLAVVVEAQAPPVAPV